MSVPSTPDRPAAPRLPEHPPALPLPDEPHIDAWLAYERDARERGAFPALQDRFVQLRFPIQDGMSRDAAYRAATLRGNFEAAGAFAPGLVPCDRRAIDLAVHPTIAGRVPVLTIADRRDFVTIVQALTERNEPVPVPASVGACLVAGLNNWDRIATYRAEWERTRQHDHGETWADEFQRLVPQKALYQDRFILLSRSPYSGVTAAQAGLDEAEWLAQSLVIRREHECTHYFVYRLCGLLPHSVMDELVADFVGLVRAFGTYRADLARRFLGLEAWPTYRSGGRLEYYRGDRELAGAAFRDLVEICGRAIGQLDEVGRACLPAPRRVEKLARVVFVLSRLSLEDCAQDGAVDRVGRELALP